MALLLLLAGYESEATNGIVKRFMMAGGGDPKQLADEQIRAWITSHAQVRQALIPLCATKRMSASGDWARTDEGRVCATVPSRNGIFYTPSGQRTL
jgi:hypothetical protein